MSLEPTECRPQNDTVDSLIPNNFVIPLTRDQPSSITSPMASTLPPLGPTSSSRAPDNASSSNGTGNKSNQHSGMSFSYSSSSVSSTSYEPSLLDNINESDQNSTIQPSNPMTSRSKIDIHKPVQKLCLSAIVHDSSNLTVSHVSPSTKPSKLSPTTKTSTKRLQPSSLPKTIEPRTVLQDLKDPNWYAAMTAEISALQSQGTWSFVPSVPHAKPVGSKWLFHVKYNSDGSIGRYKDWLVAKGYLQRPGVDYFGANSPVAKNTTLRVVQ